MKNSDNSKNIVTVKSSAGAGKTYRLALRYLQLIAPASPVSREVKNNIANIIAITFTNKAAAEMRSRIIDWMKRIILDISFEGRDRKPVDEVLESLGFDEPGDASCLTKRKAEVVDCINSNFSQILKNFYDFKVSTIDSFVSLILKASAFKLNLPADFEITTESSRYADMVLQETIQSILDDPVSRGVFDRFIEHYVEVEGERIGWIPKQFIGDIVFSLWREEAKENGVFVSTVPVGTLSEYRESACSVLAGITEEIKGRSGLVIDKRFLNAINNAAARGDFEYKLSSYLARPNILSVLNKGSTLPDEGLEEMWRDFHICLGKFFSVYSLVKYASYVEIFALFKGTLMREVTRRRKLILIDELNRLLRVAIGDGPSDFVPEIYYTLADRYFHFLIDEFQDTNHLQWKNINVLVEEALSRGGTLFLVGDRKQAIYRWRGGRSELVDEVAEHYRQFGQSALILDRNYRSRESVVFFNNVLFDAAHLEGLVEESLTICDDETKARVLSVYGQSAQTWSEAHTGSGYVLVERLSGSDDGDASSGTSAREDRDRLVREYLAELVADIRSRGVCSDDGIAILTRRNEEARFIVKLLMEMGIPVESEMTVNIRNDVLIGEIISFFRFANAPEDNLAFASFITGEIFLRRTDFSGTKMASWLVDTRMSRPATALSVSFRKDYPDIYEEQCSLFTQLAGYLPLYDFAVLFLKQWHVIADFPGSIPYCLRLLELITEREAEGQGTLTDFLFFWDEVSSPFSGGNTGSEEPFLLKSPEGVRGIRVMTVHKAKGLEFPVVILPFLKITTYGSSDSRDKTKFFHNNSGELTLQYIKKDFTTHSAHLRSIYGKAEEEYFLDETNSVYVACTRAEQELYILMVDSHRTNLLEQYIFSLEAFKPYRRANRIEIGTKGVRGRIHGAGTDRPDAALCHFQRLFAASGDTIRWAGKIGTKLVKPGLSGGWQEQAARMGDVVHYILSRIEWISDDPSAEIRRAVREGIVFFREDSAREAELAAMIGHYLDRPMIRVFFEYRAGCMVFREKEIVDSTGNIHVVDRLMISDDSIDIIDYKTGEKKNEEHRRQVDRYGHLMTGMYPGLVIRKHILYLEDNEVLTL